MLKLLCICIADMENVYMSKVYTCLASLPLSQTTLGSLLEFHQYPERIQNLNFRAYQIKNKALCQLSEPATSVQTEPRISQKNILPQHC